MLTLFFWRFLRILLLSSLVPSLSYRMMELHAQVSELPCMTL